jgi:hypothetical protein
MEQPDNNTFLQSLITQANDKVRAESILQQLMANMSRQPIASSNNHGVVVQEIPIIDPPAIFNAHGLLTRLFVQTKIRKWATLTREETERIFYAARRFQDPQHNILPINNDNFLVLERVQKSYGRGRIFHEMSYGDAEQMTMAEIDSDFPGVKELLLHFYGRIVAAGGAIFRRFNKLDAEGGDIDLFFIDPEAESDTISDAEKSQRATALLEDAVAFLTNSWMNDPDFNYSDNVDPEPRNVRYVLVTRNEFVTTVHLIHFREETIKIQFIHRLYPNVGSILGGFDLTPCMVAYDGYRILTIEIGAWSVFGALLIVDISRRSTSFEHRLHKYGKFCHLIFPGLAPDVRPPHTLKWREKDGAIDVISRTIAEYGFTCSPTKYGTAMKLRPHETALITEKRDELMARFVNMAYAEGFRLEDLKTSQLQFIHPDQRENEKSLKKTLRERLYQIGYFFNFDSFLHEGSRPETYGLKKMDVHLKLPRADLKIRCGDRTGPNYESNKVFNLRPTRAPDVTYTVDMDDSDYRSSTVIVAQTGGNGQHREPSDYEETTEDPQFAVLNNLALLASGRLGGITSCLVILRPGNDLDFLMHDDAPHQIAARQGLQQCVAQIQSTKSAKIIQQQIQSIVKSRFSKVNLGDIQQVLSNYRQRAVFLNRLDDLDFTTDNAAGLLFPFRDSPRQIENSEWEALEAKICHGTEVTSRNLDGVKWIIRNPGRQWTSSINPIVADPRDWYGEHYRSYRVGNHNTEICLRLFRLRHGNGFSRMPRDLFNYFMGFVVWADSYPEFNLPQMSNAI